MTCMATQGCRGETDTTGTVGNMLRQFTHCDTLGSSTVQHLSRCCCLLPALHCKCSMSCQRMHIPYLKIQWLTFVFHLQCYLSFWAMIKEECPHAGPKLTEAVLFEEITFWAVWVFVRYCMLRLGDDRPTIKRRFRLFPKTKIDSSGIFRLPSFIIVHIFVQHL